MAMYDKRDAEIVRGLVATLCDTAVSPELRDAAYESLCARMPAREVCYICKVYGRWEALTMITPSED